MNYGEVLKHRVDAAWETNNEEDGLRSHLGASVIGRSCMRAIWYSWLWADREEFPGRMLRLFQRGHRQEEIFADLLRGVGATVKTHDANGQQFRVSALGGHFGGSLDGVACNLPVTEHPYTLSTWFLLEFKTHNEKSFRHLVKNGVAESKPSHYKQANVYMHLSGSLDVCLYMAVNKNTDELYFEVFPRDDEQGTYLINRAASVIYGGRPSRISTYSSHFECKFCPFQSVCWFYRTPLVNCRTCRYSTCNPDGTWSCQGNQPEINTSPKTGCQYYSLRADLSRC